jgi:hypothetical protein
MILLGLDTIKNFNELEQLRQNKIFTNYDIININSDKVIKITCIGIIIDKTSMTYRVLNEDNVIASFPMDSYMILKSDIIVRPEARIFPPML